MVLVVFRAYYWLPALHDHGWHNVGIFMISIALEIADQKPKQFVIARDSPVKTIRREQFMTIKQIEWKCLTNSNDKWVWFIKLLLNCIFQLYKHQGEADDIVGIEGAGSAWKIDNCCMWWQWRYINNYYDHGRRLWSCKRCFSHPCILHVSFTPEQYLDYLSLIGDSSDNIPGVSWIWPKGALQLIQRFGSLDGIYDHLDEIAPATAEKLRVGQLQWQESKQLITLMVVPDVLKNVTRFWTRTSIYSFECW